MSTLNLPPAGRAAPTAEVRLREGVTRLKHPGRWVSALVTLAIVVFIVRAFALGQIAWPVVGQYLFEPIILAGLANTLIMTVAAFVFGLVLGVILAVMRLSTNPVMSTVSWAYIWIFRGTPVLLQLLLWFNVALIIPKISLFGLDVHTVSIISPFLAALLGLGMNEGAYQAEIIRAGIISVDAGQTEAAHSLGMNGARTMRRVILPQAMRVVIPPMGNEFINLLKTTSLASVIAYGEVLYRSEQIYYQNNRVMELLFVASIWYLVAVTVFSVGQHYLERRFARGSGVSNLDNPVTLATRGIKQILSSSAKRSERGAR